MSNKSSPFSSYDNEETQVANTFDVDASSVRSEGFDEYADDDDGKLAKKIEIIAREGEVAPPGYGMVNLDEVLQSCSQMDSHTTGDQIQNGIDIPSVVLRRSLADSTSDIETRRNSFKKQVRLSRMLENEDTSSSDDDDLYTYGSTSQSLQKSQSQPQISFGIAHHTVGQPDGAASPHPFLLTSVEPVRRERVPMQVLSGIVNPNVLKDGKMHLKRVFPSEIRDTGPVEEPSPAKIWEMKKKMRDEKLLLNKAQASKLKAGWKVRQCLNSLPDGETVNTFYLTLVRKGMLREVEALFSLAKVAITAHGLNKNFKDDDEKSALTIAIDNKNETMMARLIKYGVDLDLSIFHAVEADFMEGLKLLVIYDPCTYLKITCENPYFQIGMTPMLLAAHNNNYRMLSLLHEYGHRLQGLTEWSEGIHVAWESANERRMICEARAQSAFITLTAELNRMNPMKYCMQEIRKLREYGSQEQAFSSFYKRIISELEDYMCSLLDNISSSEELADLFQFEFLTPNLMPQAKLQSFIEGAKTERWALGNRFKLLERASKERLVRFVTHQQSQLALSYLRYRSLPYLQNNIIVIFIGLWFPILSLLYVFAPNTVLGSIITLPTVSFSCHMMSDVVFALLLLLNISFKNPEQDRLGAGPNAIEFLIFIWILGKWVQEMQECINRGLKAYLRDYWNYSDLAMLFLFSAGIALRIFDMISNRDASVLVYRSDWNQLEPKLIAGGLQAWAYVFFFIRLLGIMRVDRTLGPLQISLAKMLFDIVRFLCLFSLVIFAFAFGLSDLYWYYGTKEGSRMFCTKGGNSAGANDTCTGQTPAFTTIYASVIDLFWALFGLFDLTTMSLGGKHSYTEGVGRSLVATYHVVAIIVMLNMLIAMMSNSYNDTSENEETAWKFHRTSMWIRFIRREVVRPPPMNLFPNPWKLRENLKRLRSFFCNRKCCCMKKTLTESVYDKRGRRVDQSYSINIRMLVLEGIESNPEKGELTPVIKSPEKNDKRGSPTDETRGGRAPRIIVRDGSKTSPYWHGRENNAGFTSAGLQEVKNVIAATLRKKRPKDISMKLVRRYKLKHLIKKRSPNTSTVI